MTVYRNEGKFDASNVVFRDDEIVVYDKKLKLPEMQHIDYGLSVFKSSGFDGYAADQALILAKSWASWSVTNNSLVTKHLNDFMKWVRPPD